MTKNIYNIFNMIIIAAIVYACVVCFYLFVEAKLDQPEFNTGIIKTEQKVTKLPRKKLSDYRIIHIRNIFGGTAQQGEISDETEDIEDLEPTSLKISLVGTVSGDQKSAAAIIQDETKRSQDLYRVGDSIQNAVIQKILRGKIILSYMGRDEILVMDEPDSGNNISTPSRTTAPTPAVTTPQRTITVRRNDILKSLEDLNDVLSQANIKPHFTDGKADGLSISTIRANSVFRKMGFRNGDIVKNIEGNEIKGPEDLISLYNDLKSNDSVSLDIIRRGREMTLNYRLR